MPTAIDTRQPINLDTHQPDAPEPNRHIVRLTLRDIGHFGPEPVTFRFTQASIITGENFLGKTTVYKVILGLQDEHNPDLIREGCEKGYVTAEYSDGMVVDQLVTHRGSEIKITLGDGRRVTKRPKEFLREMANGYALDPMRLVTEKDKQRRKAFLQALLPLKFSKAEIEQICGPTRLTDVILLDGFDQFVSAVRESRTEQKRILDSHTSILAEYERTMAPKDDTDWGAEKKAATTALQQLRLAVNKELGDWKVAYEQNVASITATHDKRIRTIEQERDAAIAKITADAQRQIDQERHSKASTLADAQTLLAEESAAIQKRYEPQIEEATRREEQAESNHNQQQQLAGIQRLMAQTREKIESEGAKWSVLNDRVKGLEELRNVKLSQMPLKGIEIHDTSIIVDGLDFDTQLCGAEQIIAAFKIAALASGGLPLVVFDEIEKLGVALDDLIAEAKKKNMQFIGTKVVRGQQVLQVEAA